MINQESVSKDFHSVEHRIVGVRENPDLLDRAVDYFTQKWGIDRRIYMDCIGNSITTRSPLPRWYLLMKQDEIIGGYGLITNDFISRQDLWPWFCALYIEEPYRGHQLGARLLEHGRTEAGKLGFKKLYLATDHVGYYEKYGWSCIGDGFHPWGDQSGIYERETVESDGETGEISVAGREDFPEILTIQKLAYLSEAEIYGDYSIPPLRETLEELSRDAEESVILKCVADGRIIGSVRGTPKGDHVYIGRLFVHPDFRNYGIGKRLLAAIEAHFPDMRYELFTGGRSEKNLAFYEKAGYRRIRVEKVSELVNLVYMEKPGSELT